MASASDSTVSALGDSATDVAVRVVKLPRAEYRTERALAVPVLGGFGSEASWHSPQSCSVTVTVTSAFTMATRAMAASVMKKRMTAVWKVQVGDVGGVMHERNNRTKVLGERMKMIGGGGWCVVVVVVGRELKKINAWRGTAHGPPASHYLQTAQGVHM